MKFSVDVDVIHSIDATAWLQEKEKLCCIVNCAGTLYGKRICRDCYLAYWYAYHEKKKEKNSLKETSSQT